jgi:hypothetical protein
VPESWQATKKPDALAGLLVPENGGQRKNQPERESIEDLRACCSPLNLSDRKCQMPSWDKIKALKIILNYASLHQNNLSDQNILPIC